MEKSREMTWRYNAGLFGGGNYILDGGDFSISYNPNPGSIMHAFAGDNGSDETALCKDGKFFILNGDFRLDYEQLVSQGYAVCFAFYESKKDEYNSSWSSKEEKSNDPA